MTAIESEREEWRALANADTLHLLPTTALIASIKHLAERLLTIEAELAAWENREPLSPDPERVQLAHLAVENERLRAALTEAKVELQVWINDAAWVKRPRSEALVARIDDALGTPPSPVSPTDASVNGVHGTIWGGKSQGPHV